MKYPICTYTLLAIFKPIFLNLIHGYLLKKTLSQKGLLKNHSFKECYFLHLKSDYITIAFLAVLMFITMLFSNLMSFEAVKAFVVISVAIGLCASCGVWFYVFRYYLKKWEIEIGSIFWKYLENLAILWIKITAALLIFSLFVWGLCKWQCKTAPENSGAVIKNGRVKVHHC